MNHSGHCRLLYVVGQLRAGGLERQLCFLLDGLDRERYRPEVVVWNLHESDTYVSRLRKLPVPLHSFPDILPGAKKVTALRRLVRRIRPEVVHSYTFYTNFAAWWATRGSSSIAIGAVQSDFIRDRRNSGPWLGALSARWPRHQIFNSVMAVDNARRTRGLFVPEQRFMVRNGLDLRAFKAPPLSSNGPVRILGIGSLLPVKRWDRVLVAAAALKALGLHYVVQIAGGGPARESLQRQADALGVGDCVKFLGHVGNVAGLLADATFVVHTSETEGTPNAVIEAMACGRAVIATDAGDVPLMVDDGKSGYVVRRGDGAMLVARMASLIEDRELCRRMGEAGRAKAERDFGLDRLVTETLAVYRSAGWSDS